MKKLAFVDNLNRRVDFVERSTYFYLYLAVVTLAIFGVVGLWASLSTLARKFDTLAQLTGTKDVLVAKISDLENLRGVLRFVRSDLKYFEDVFPKQVPVQELVGDLISSATRAGYKIEKVSSNADDSGNLNVHVTYSGGGSLPALVNNVEDLKKTTEIKKITLFQSRNIDVVNMDLVLYIEPVKQ